MSQQQPQPPALRCYECGYELHGLSQYEACPECGKKVWWTQMKRRPRVPRKSFSRFHFTIRLALAGFLVYTAMFIWALFGGESGFYLLLLANYPIIVVVNLFSDGLKADASLLMVMWIGGPVMYTCIGAAAGTLIDRRRPRN